MGIKKMAIPRRQMVCAALMLGALFYGGPAHAQGTDRETVHFEIYVDPVFFVETTSNRGGNIELGPLLPNRGPASEIAKIAVHTNTGKAYRIIQQLDQPLISETGVEFPARDISFVASDGMRGGRSEIKSPTPLSSQPTTIFRSNLRGDADEFTITYLIKSKRVIPAGLYRARISVEGELQ